MAGDSDSGGVGVESQWPDFLDQFTESLHYPDDVRLAGGFGELAGQRDIEGVSWEADLQRGGVRGPPPTEVNGKVLQRELWRLDLGRGLPVAPSTQGWVGIGRWWWYILCLVVRCAAWMLTST